MLPLYDEGTMQLQSAAIAHVAARFSASADASVIQPSLLIGSHIEASKLEVRKISLHRLHLAQQEGALRAAAAA